MKATMIITDKPSGEISVNVEFDPPLTVDAPNSSAVRATLIALDAIKKHASPHKREICCLEEGEECCDCGACPG